MQGVYWLAYILLYGNRIPPKIETMFSEINIIGAAFEELSVRPSSNIQTLNENYLSSITLPQKQKKIDIIILVSLYPLYSCSYGGRRPIRNFTKEWNKCDFLD